MSQKNLKYPIGKWCKPENLDEFQIKTWIKIIKEFPTQIQKEIKDLTQKELDYKYRPNSWTIKQVVAHCLDSHINSLVRFKLALTEENPIIKPYAEEKWAELSDTLNYDVEEIMVLLFGIHKRWVFLLESLTKAQLNKTFVHPNGNEVITLKENISIYAWHCKHHLQHVIHAKKHKNLY